MLQTNNLSKEKIIIYFFVLLTLISYLIGFLLNENSSGGAQVDFEYVKMNLLAFKTHGFFESLKLTAIQDINVFKSSRTPGFYLFNKYLNPFALNYKYHQAFITILSLLIPFLFFLNLKIKYALNNYYLLLLSCTILLSPYLRSSAFWGIEENFGIIMVGFSALFLQLYINCSERKKEIFFLFFLGIFSSLCVYFDQKLIIIPLISLLSVLTSNKKNFDKLFLSLLYFFLSLPFVYLINLWGNIMPPVDVSARHFNQGIKKILNYHHLLYSISIIAFYLFPAIIFLENKKEIFYKILNNKINIFLTILIIFFIFYFLFYFRIENMYYLGGGVFHKLTLIFTNNIIIQKTLLTIIFIISWLILLLFINNITFNYFILLCFPVLSLLIGPAIFQEYFDPLIFFIILVYLKNNYKFNLIRIVYFFLYFLLLLIVANFFYN